MSENEIIKNFLSDFEVGPAPSPPPAPTIEQLLETARSIGDRPQLGRLEVGSLVHAAVKARLAPRERLSPAPLSGLYGVPVVEPEGDEALEPTAWRLLDTTGEVIKEGAL